MDRQPLAIIDSFTNTSLSNSIVRLIRSGYAERTGCVLLRWLLSTYDTVSRSFLSKFFQYILAIGRCAFIRESTKLIIGSVGRCNQLINIGFIWPEPIGSKVNSFA